MPRWAGRLPVRRPSLGQAPYPLRLAQGVGILTACERLLPESAYDSLPLVSHELVAAVGGVNAIPDPIISGSFHRGCVVENSLKVDECRSVLGRQFRNDGLSGEDVVGCLWAVVFFEGRTEDELELWICGACFGEELVVDLLVFVEGHIL